jgi:ubiquinone/menaquinone biosynthesis C-methylase UbiE
VGGLPWHARNFRDEKTRGTMATIKSIRSFWNEKAKENPYWFISSARPYEAQRDLDDFWASGERIWHQLKSAIGYQPHSSDRVIEIGCGVGRLSRVIAPEVARLDALDISDEMLAIARQAALPNAVFHRAEGFALSQFEDSSADLVLAYCVFQHLPSIEALQSYLEDMVRVAKAGATIAFTLVPRTMTDNLMPLVRARAYLRERLGRQGPRGVYRREWIGIRPRLSCVYGIAPIPLTRVSLFGDQWLFFGRKV